MANADSDSPAHVVELADACVRYVEQALELKLDYTQDTLPILDHYLRTAAQDPRPEIEALLAPTAGAYFGELVRRIWPHAQWHAPGEDYAHYRIEFRGFFLHFNPVGLAREVVDAEDAPGWNGHFAMFDDARTLVESSLTDKLSMRDGDYYSLSVRYETLEQTADVLEALAVQGPKPRPTFGADVYASALGQAPSADN